MILNMSIWNRVMTTFSNSPTKKRSRNKDILEVLILPCFFYDSPWTYDLSSFLSGTFVENIPSWFDTPSTFAYPWLTEEIGAWWISSYDVTNLNGSHLTEILNADWKTKTTSPSPQRCKIRYKYPRWCHTSGEKLFTARAWNRSQKQQPGSPNLSDYRDKNLKFYSYFPNLYPRHFHNNSLGVKYPCNRTNVFYQASMGMRAIDLVWKIYFFVLSYRFSTDTQLRAITMSKFQILPLETLDHGNGWILRTLPQKEIFTLLLGL